VPAPPVVGSADPIGRGFGRRPRAAFLLVAVGRPALVLNWMPLGLQCRKPVDGEIDWGISLIGMGGCFGYQWPKNVGQPLHVQPVVRFGGQQIAQMVDEEDQ
jgi:hypothetical protein